MPPSAPFYSIVHPYRIRVDDFTTPKDPTFQHPALYLLSHTHSDHLTGLSTKSFGSRVVCSKDSKHMLLNNEPANERIAFDNGDKSARTRPYAHLKIDRHQPGVFARDLLHPVPLNTPTQFELSDDVTITLTLLDANHCPGSVMFLIEGPEGNILHTGDMRAEPAFLTGLSRNPLLQRYIRPSTLIPDSIGSDSEKPLKTLDAIYLDTACLLSHHDLLTKEEACSGLVKLMTFFPPSTKFFINAWTPGYEDILKAIGRSFNSKVHVDRYKYLIYTGINDPFLRSLLTCDPDATRFHACERFNRCEVVQYGSSDVVYINPVTLSKSKWQAYYAKTMASFDRGEPVNNLLCPLSRHSSLPELRSFVALFKPKLVVPNFLNPALGNFDWACIPKMFAGCLAEGGEMAIRSSMQLANVFIDDLDYIPPSEESEIIEAGVELDNVIGEGAEVLAKKWTGSEGFTQSPSSRLFVRMKKFLGPRGQLLLAEYMSSMTIQAGADHDSDGYDENDEEARERTAKLLLVSPSDCSSSVGKSRNRAQSVPSRSPWSSPTFTIPSRLKGRRPTNPFTPPSFSQKIALSEKLPSSSHEIPPLRERQNSSTRKNFRSIYDMICFKKSSPSSSHRPLTTVYVQPPSASPNNLASPFSTPSRIRGSAKNPVFLRLPLASPSISPSPRRVCGASQPHLSPKFSSPPEQFTRVQDDFQASPDMGLTRKLKRILSDAESPQSPKRVKPNLEEFHVTEFLSHSLSTVSQQVLQKVHDGHPRNELVSLSPLKPKPDIISALMPLAISISEKQRRAKAKAKQIEIREKLLRALPRDQISSYALGKVEERRRLAKEKEKRSRSVKTLKLVSPLESAG